jgi:hypothetical protein
MIIMSNMIETLLLRNLQEVFGEGDPERRRQGAFAPGTSTTAVAKIRGMSKSTSKPSRPPGKRAATTWS